MGGISSKVSSVIHNKIFINNSINSEKVECFEAITSEMLEHLDNGCICPENLIQVCDLALGEQVSFSVQREFSSEFFDKLQFLTKHSDPGSTGFYTKSFTLLIAFAVICNLGANAFMETVYPRSFNDVACKDLIKTLTQARSLVNIKLDHINFPYLKKVLLCIDDKVRFEYQQKRMYYDMNKLRSPMASKNDVVSEAIEEVYKRLAQENNATNEDHKDEEKKNYTYHELISPYSGGSSISEEAEFPDYHHANPQEVRELLSCDKHDLNETKET